MKATLSVFIAVLVFMAPVLAISEGDDTHVIFRDRDCHLSHFDISLDRGTIIIESSHNRGGRVEITEDYELYINGDRVELNDEQAELVEEFYLTSMDIVDYGVAIGLEGARIGIDGAKLGLKALGGVMKLIFTGYDEDDLEREMEREAARLEAKAEVLEDEAEIIEEMAEELEDIAEEMKYEIPELEELRWF